MALWFNFLSSPFNDSFILESYFICIIYYKLYVVQAGAQARGSDTNLHDVNLGFKQLTVHITNKCPKWFLMH